MLTRIHLIFLLFTAIAGDALFAQEATMNPNSCRPSKNARIILSRQIFTMGTLLTITAEADQRSTSIAAIEAGIEAVEDINTRLSTWKTDTELSALNHSPTGSWIPISGNLAEDLEEAIFWSIETSGAFHPALGPLINLWDLRGSGKIPADDEISNALGQISLSHIDLENNRAKRRIAEFAFEEGGFAKGRALREAGDAGIDAGAQCIRFDFGGQLFTRGACAPDTISLADPLERFRTIAGIKHNYRSSATSGLSERHFRVGSQSFGHILNPHTGQPLDTSMSLTLLGDDPVATDCLSTAFLVMGPEHSFEWLQSHPSFAAIFAVVTDDKVKLLASANLSGLIKPYDATITIHYH